jgi:hypothetical protein
MILTVAKAVSVEEVWQISKRRGIWGFFALLQFVSFFLLYLNVGVEF